jgi:hypothetical protein
MHRRMECVRKTWGNFFGRRTKLGFSLLIRSINNISAGFYQSIMANMRGSCALIREVEMGVGMKALLFAFVVGCALGTGVSNAKTRFEKYESRNAIVEGTGGSRSTKDGIDFWTTGDPPRRYQIIGIIRDNRGTGVFFGNAVGSSGIAKKVHEVGGDAVILMNQNSSIKGVWSQGHASGYGNQAYGSALSIPIEERVTTFAVVKYLPDLQSAPISKIPANTTPPQ